MKPYISNFGFGNSICQKSWVCMSEKDILWSRLFVIEASSLYPAFFFASENALLIFLFRIANNSGNNN